MRKYVLFTLVLLFATIASFAAEKPVIKSQDDKISYSVGQQVGRDMVRQRVDVRPEVLLQGILDAINDAEPMLSMAEQVDTLATLKEKIVQDSDMRRADLKEKGLEFMQENAAKEGVVALESGLQYKILKKGQGKKPEKTDMVRVNYVGRNVLDMEISSSYKDGVANPVEFAVNKVIPGWGEALQLMQEGDKWEIYIPYQLAFNDRGPLAWQMVFFEVELLEVVAQN